MTEQDLRSMTNAATDMPEAKKATDLQQAIGRGTGCLDRMNKISIQLMGINDRLSPVPEDPSATEPHERPDGDMPALSWVMTDMESTLDVIERRLSRLESSV